MTSRTLQSPARVMRSPLPVAIHLCLAVLSGGVVAADNTTVRVHIVDAATDRITPAMVCITSKADRSVRLPPDGRICRQPGTTKEFYEGVRFGTDPDWIGPVRKMAGRGDNNDRSFVYEDRPTLPWWHEPCAYQTSGDFSITLPAGDWRLAVARGMEYVPVVDEFTLAAATAGPVVRTLRLERWINLPQRGWWSGDVHVHHPLLNGEHEEFLLHYAMAEDLHVANLLEMGHHKGTDFKQRAFGRKARVRRGDYCLAAGQEEPRSTFGHIIGLNVSSFARVDDIGDYEFYDIVFRRIHEQPGALVGFAHLAWNGCALPRGFPWYVTTGEIDFVELLQFGLVNRMDYYDYLNLGFRLTAAAGSDVPWGSTMGEVRTFVHTGPNLDLDAWFAGLKKGNTFVSNGPALFFQVDGKLPGSEIAKAAGESVSITVEAFGHPRIGIPKTLAVVGNEGVIKEITNPAQAQHLKIELDRRIDHSQWLVAHAVCDIGTVAHTTPVYVVVGGKPTWCPNRAPALIERQLAEIDKIAAEFPDTGPGSKGRGVQERLQRARAAYAGILGAMKAETANGRR